MIRRFKSASLSILIATVLILGIQWALTSSSSAAVASINVDQQPVISDAPLTETAAYTTYLPLVASNQPPAEFRGLWVRRFDWTRFGHTVTTADLDTIVNNAASAHFNVLHFQVRGTADAYYSSTLEPWAARLTGSITKTLGVDPGFDPLAYLITRAHQSGLQVHAYLNVFSTWVYGFGAPPGVDEGRGSHGRAARVADPVSGPRSAPIRAPGGQTQPVGFGSPAILQACLAGP